MVVFRGPEIVGATEWQLLDEGQVSFVWDAVVDGDVAPPGIYRVVVSARTDEAVSAAVGIAIVTPVKCVGPVGSTSG